MATIQNISSNPSDAIKSYKSCVLLPWSMQNELDPLPIKHAEGVYLTLDNDKKLIDMSSQSFYANLGHNHQGMKDALHEGLKDLSVLNSHAFLKERLSLALKLKSISKQAKGKVFFTTGGADANENAIKMARLYTKKYKIITRHKSYHGATMQALNASGDYRRIPFDSATNGIIRFIDPLFDSNKKQIDTINVLEEIIKTEGEETIAAILLEGITGANGVYIPSKDYWMRIKNLCDKYNILLIADEVLSGFFRTGKWFGVNHFDVNPDIITMAKGLTAGYAALGAVLVNNDIASFFNDNTLYCGLTNYGLKLSCSAALAALDHYEDKELQENIYHRSRELKEFLHHIKDECKNVADIRSIGLLSAIDLKKGEYNEEPLIPDRAKTDELRPLKILKKILHEQGISCVVRFNTLFIAPPFIITSSELLEGLDKIKISLKKLYSYG